MPHAVYNIGVQSAGGNFQARQLIPGIEPGGSRVGKSKPTLLILDVWIEPKDYSALTTSDFNAMTYYLKLSQEPDLTPGLILPVGIMGSQVLEADATGRPTIGINSVTKDLFHAQGTRWAPAYVGAFLLENGSLSTDADLHLDYEQVEAEWMDWFILWDFLDNIIDNETQY